MNYRNLKNILETFTEDQLDYEVLGSLESSYNIQQVYYKIDFILQDDTNKILDVTHPYFELKGE